MADWQFGVLVILLVAILWRNRDVGQTSPWLRDALLRRMFEQLNCIEAKVCGIPIADLEKETELWWQGEASCEAGRSKGWPWPWAERPKCGPWCHRDWNTRGFSRLDEIEYERTHPHQESEESKKETFERRRGLAEADFGCQYEVGRSYELGWGVEKDWNEALRWYRRAAENGDHNAQYRLASAYFDGDGVAVDYATAYFWLKLKEMDSGVDAVGDLLNQEQRAEVENRCREWIESNRAGNT